MLSLINSISWSLSIIHYHIYLFIILIYSTYLSIYLSISNYFHTCRKLGLDTLLALKMFILALKISPVASKHYYELPKFWSGSKNFGQNLSIYNLSFLSIYNLSFLSNYLTIWLSIYLSTWYRYSRWKICYFTKSKQNKIIFHLMFFRSAQRIPCIAKWFSKDKGGTI